MGLIFWISIIMIVYIYMLYPMLLLLTSFLKKTQEAFAGEYHPSVALLVSAYNEEEIIKKKIENCVRISYPRELLNIYIVSDGSQDKTDSIVNSYKNQGIQLIRVEGRGGKMAALNEAIPKTQGEILVFSDANSMYAEDALQQLVRPFKDTNVGGVSGELRYTNEKGSNIGDSEGAYWKYEQLQKKLESKISSVTGANGAIYAIRRELHQPLDPKVPNDFQHPFKVVRQGYRVLYSPTANAYEEAAPNSKGEFKRKIRIISRSILGCVKNGDLMNPFVYGIYAIQLLSHKLLRWLSPVFLIGAFISNLFIIGNSPLYKGIMILQILCYALGIIGYFVRDKKFPGNKAFTIPYYFLMVNYASLLGLVKFLTGNTHSTWAPTKR